MGSTEQESIAKLQVQFEFLNGTVNELKADVKDVSTKLDNLLMEWQKFGGLYNSVSSIQLQVNELQKWKDDVNPAITSVKDSKKKLFDIFWYVVQSVTMLAVLYLLKYQQ